MQSLAGHAHWAAFQVPGLISDTEAFTKNKFADLIAGILLKRLIDLNLCT